MKLIQTKLLAIRTFTISCSSLKQIDVCYLLAVICVSNTEYNFV